eukprot:146949_1
MDLFNEKNIIKLIPVSIGSTLFILLILATIYDIVVKYKKYGQNTKAVDDTSKDLRILIYINILSALLRMINIIMRIFITSDGFYCQLLSHTAPTTYHIMRCSMY